MVATLVGLVTVVLGGVVALVVDMLKNRRDRRQRQNAAALCLLDSLDWAHGEVEQAMQSGDWSRLTLFGDLRAQWLVWLKDLGGLHLSDLYAIEEVARFFASPPDPSEIARSGPTALEQEELRTVHQKLERALDVLYGAMRP
jgi:hypothetical protein